MRPAFACDALEHDKQCPEDVVEVGDSVVGILIHLAAEVAFGADLLASAEVVLDLVLLASVIVHASLLHKAAE